MALQNSAANGWAPAAARGLGWFSIGLGAVEALIPGFLARRLGMEGKETMLRVYGAREIAVGIGLLTTKNPAPWLWGRVAVDALDLATLATGLTGQRRRNAAIALAAVAGVTALDAVCAQALGNAAPAAAKRPVRDYGDRRGMPRPVEAMRGAARDFAVPRDMRTPEALRPYPRGLAAEQPTG
jgi:hypothetical protein